VTASSSPSNAGEISALWLRQARQWAHIGPPLRPVAEDLRLLERLAEEAFAGAGVAKRALLLGVTQEIAAMHWPADTTLVAVDRSLAMVTELWPGNTADIRRYALNADWRMLPVADRSVTIIIGDGSYSALDTLAGQDAMSAEIVRALAPEGRLAIRLYARPEIVEPTDVVFDDLRSGRIGSFHAFKWRLAMSLPMDDDFSVRVADVWDAWQAARIDGEELARRCGWPPTAVQTIASYRENDTRYTFPPLSVVRQRFAGFFQEIDCFKPSYEIGDRCPTLLLTPKMS
jgi:SAM-dependent methyltransferase